MNELAKIIMDVSQNPEKSNLTKIQDWFQGEGRGITATKDIPLKNPPLETSRYSNDVGNNEPLKLDDIANSPGTYELTPLSKDTADSLKSENWDQDVVEKITSEEEAQIYKNANIEPAEVNGKPVLARNDIDPDLKGPDGKTNLERMREGNAPYYADENGKLKRYELHHIGQKNDAPLAELTQKEHRQDGNDLVLHPNQKESEINRPDFNKERAEHWKARAEQIESKGN